MEQKLKIFAKIKKNSMSAVEVIKAYGVSRTTAYEWKSLVQTNQPPPPNAGRQKTFSEASVKAWHEVLDEAQNNHQAIPVQKKPKLQSLPSVKEVALEALKLTPNKHNISLSKRQIKYHSKQHGIENVNAQDKTEKRARAITDARNCMAMLCLAIYYQYSLCFNYLLHFNIDSTGFGIDLIGGGKKVQVAVTTKGKLKAKEEKVPISTPQTKSDTGVCIKHMTAICRDGTIGPSVWSIAAKDALKGKSYTRKVNNTYLAVHQNREGSDDYWTWYYKTVLFPYIAARRAALNDHTSIATVQMDGEDIQMKPLLFGGSCYKLALEQRILFLKPPPNSTEVSQPLDKGRGFSGSKTAVDSDLAFQFERMNNSGLGAELVEAFNEIFREAELTIDSVRRKKWVSGILRATYAIQHAFTFKTISDSFNNVGLVNAHGAADIPTIAKNFKQNISHIPAGVLMRELKQLAEELRQFGTLSSATLDKTMLVQTSIAAGKSLRSEKVTDEDKILKSRRMLVINHKDLSVHIARRKTAVAKALQDAKDVLLQEKEEQKRAVRLEKAEIAAAKKAEIKAQKALSKELAEQAKSDEKSKKKRPRSGSDAQESAASNFKRKRDEDSSDIQATVANIYGRPRINLRRTGEL